MAANNQYVDEIDGKYGQLFSQLSPGSQQAVHLSGLSPQTLGIQPAPVAPPPQRPLAAPSTMLPGAAGIGVPSRMAAAPAAAQLPAPRQTAMIPPIPITGGGSPGEPVMPAQPPALPVQGPIQGLAAPEMRPAPLPLSLNPRFAALAARQNELTNPQLRTSGSGIEQIRNPVLRPLAKIGDALLSGFFPRVAMFTPGTGLHHQLLVSQNLGQMNAMEQQATAEEQRQRMAAETAAIPGEEELRKAQTAAELAKIPHLANPRPTNLMEWYQQAYPGSSPKEYATFEQSMKPVTSELAQFAREHPDSKDLLGDYLALKQKYAKPPEGEVALGERIPQLNSALADLYQQEHPGEKPPAHWQLAPNATQKDFDRVESLLKSKMASEATAEQRATTNQLHAETVALAAAAAGRGAEKQTMAEEKQSRAERAQILKYYEPAGDAAKRLNIMTQNYEDAVKNHDQQAMLSLLAQHMGMTLGDVRNGRMTQAMINEAVKSAPWLARMATKFDSRGILTGVTLTEPQMRQMVNLGREKLGQSYQKSKNDAAYFGATDEGPKRTPSHSTMKHYFSLTNGDAAKARKMATDDGWSVE